MVGLNLKTLVLATAAMFSLPVASDAQLRSPFDNCNTCAPPPVRRVSVNPCVTCTQPVSACTCAPPVQQTRLVPQQQVSYRDVLETQYRAEHIAQQVPVTRMRNVTVDEGNYQMVWVPRVVNKQVSETVIEQRVGTRIVPYQVTKRIPQVTTTLVPQHTVGCAQPHYSTSSIYSTGPIVQQPVQLQAPITYGQPIMTSPNGYPTLAPVEPYRSSQGLQQLAPHPSALDIPSTQPATLRDLDTSSIAPSRRSGYVTSTPAASVYRQYR